MNSKEPSFQWISVESKLIYEEKEVRLNARSYSFDAIRGRKLIESIRKKLEISKIENFAKKIFVGSRVKRLFTNKKDGVPYLMPIDLFKFQLKPRKWVKKETQDLENWWVKPLTILITQSGTPGRCLLVNKHFVDKVISPNVIRVVLNAEEADLVGFIYAFLNTWIGQTFLTKTQYGETVRHIEPYHVGKIPIPLLPESYIKEINEKILEAHKLREEAQELLIKAEKLFYEELGMPLLDEDKIEYFGGEKGKNVKAFIAKASELNFRLDASYHIPIIKFLIKQMNDNSNGYLTNLSNLVEKIFIPTRFKRIYVENRKQGIPFLQGSHVPMIKLFDVKYLWRKSKNLKNIVLKKNWILMTRSGTVGEVALVTDYWNEWAGSEHILRIIPSTSVHPGYILTFLLSAYGQFQIKGKVYGGVVNEIAEQDVSLIDKIKILVPHDDKIQNKIGNLIIEAYEKKDQANIIENEAIKLLEEKLEECVK